MPLAIVGERFGAHLLRGAQADRERARVDRPGHFEEELRLVLEAVGQDDERLAVERRGAGVQRRARELDAVADRGRAARRSSALTASSTSARCMFAGVKRRKRLSRIGIVIEAHDARAAAVANQLDAA